MNATRTCAWCGDYEFEHDERGCRLCRGASQPAPWERPPYGPCDRFYKSSAEAEAAFRERLDAHEQALRP